jgi:Cytochrome oxidase complex assembly protein 1
MSDARLRIEPKDIPPELDRWNWGAFLLNWIWGIGNNTYIALLTLIPFVGFVMPFVLGAKGSRWAWRNGRWDSVEHFRRVQRQWAIWGAVILVGVLVIFGGLFGGLFYGFKHSAAYELGAETLRGSPVAAEVLGTPIVTGFPFGKINVSGGSGNAVLNFSATGPKAAGRVFLQAIKKNGAWSIRRLMLKPDGSNNEIDIVGGARSAPV